MLIVHAIYLLNMKFQASGLILRLSRLVCVGSHQSPKDYFSCVAAELPHTFPDAVAPAKTCEKLNCFCIARTRGVRVSEILNI